jgi:nicotinate-nucleotide adenylyltransferase
VTATRIGILGGTFDPIHFGHLGAAKAATECADLDRVILIPAGLPPHRSAVIAPAADRLEMTRLATEGDPHFEVSDLELRRDGPSYTADTLTELRRLHPNAELYLILGWDAAGQFNTWHQPARVRELATIVVVGRPGSKGPHAADLEAAGLGGSRVVLCLRTTPAISASEIRHAVASGKPIAGKLPPAVEGYIAAHHLYGGKRG